MTLQLEVSEAVWARIKPRLIAAAAQRALNRPGGGKKPAEVLADCKRSFRAFLPYWRFKNRDSGEVLTFEYLWPGQALLAAGMEADLDAVRSFAGNTWISAQTAIKGQAVNFGDLIERRRDRYPNGPWLFALKAGKLGFSELECAYDAWVALFRCQNARVHIFSRDLAAAKEMLRIVRYGLLHLPPWFGVHIPQDEADSNTTTSLRIVMGLDDERVIKSYATGENISIDQVAHHIHLDEWAHMKHRRGIWEDVQTTVAPGGTLHIVTRGAGDDATVRETWEAAERGDHELVPYFASWDQRPDRDFSWREAEARKNTIVGLSHFAPETPSDALAGDEDNDYLPLAAWDACFDPGLPPLMPGGIAGEPLVVALDAAVSHDTFAAVGVTRHPAACPCGRTYNDPAIRAVKVWKPESFPDGKINFRTIDGWVRVLCEGGCPGDPAARIEAHPRYPATERQPREWTARPDECGSCAAEITIPGFNVLKIVYDPYQLEDMMQRYREDGVLAGAIGPFNQTKGRLVADRGLYDLTLQRRLAHNGDALLREHVGNARAQLQPDDDSKLRIKKKDEKRRIDAVVAASMAVDECLRLLL